MIDIRGKQYYTFWLPEGTLLVVCNILYVFLYHDQESWLGCPTHCLLNLVFETGLLYASLTLLTLVIMDVCSSFERTLSQDITASDVVLRHMGCLCLLQHCLLSLKEYWCSFWLCLLKELGSFVLFFNLCLLFQD